MESAIDYRALFEGLPGLLVCLSTDADFRILTLTDAYCSATQVAREQVVGRGMFEVFTDNPDNPDRTGVRKLRYSLEQCLRTRKPHVMAVQKYDIRTADGSFEERHWTPTNTPILDPKDPQRVMYIIHRVEDVTEFVQLKKQQEESQSGTELRIRAEQMEAEMFMREKEISATKAALKELDARYNALVGILPVGVFQCDRKGMCFYVNPSWCEITGLSESDIQEQDWLDWICDDDRLHVSDEWNAQRLTNFQTECRFSKRGSSESKWALVRMCPELDASGLATGYVGTLVDITEQKFKEEESRLRSQKLMELDRAKTAFFSNVSHEFRTPLALMLGPLQELLADSRHPLNAEQKERVTMAHRNAKRLLNLVNAILDFSRIEAERAHPAFEPCDIAELVTESCGMFRSTIEKEGLEFQVACEPVGTQVYIDKQMLEKIVFNLLSNAFKFTKAGKISVSLRKFDDAVELCVRDTGIGIPEKELPRMFERFHRIEQKGGRSFEGSGIGLALTQELVRFHGGTIRVESAEGKGTAFFVTFPLGSQHLPPEFVGGGRDTYRMGDIGSTFVDEAANWISLKDRRASLPEEREASSVALADPVTVRISDGRILVVDDNADMCRYLDSLLKPHCSVSIVHDGQQALEFLKAHAEQPDLILSDIMMSNMSGLELLRAVRAKPDTASIPFILLSARAGEEAIVDGLKSGADDYLVKPFQAGELLTRVMNHIELGRLRRDLERRVEQRTVELIHTHARLQAETQERLRVEQQLNEQYKGRAVEAEQRHRKLSDFVDTLCHEIRNPLHCMFGGVALLNESLISLMSMCSVDTYSNVGKTTAAKQNLESARKYSKSIEDAAKQQTAVVNDVLTLSRLEGRSIAVKIVPFEMCAYVENLIGMFTPQLERKNLKCSFVRPPGVTELWIKADEQHLTQILINLLSNAVKYTLAGSVTVQLAVEFLADNQLKLTITVRDTGIGMEREQLARVFEGFAPSNRRHQIVEGGSGLGLAICKRLVDVMGATIEATSQKGVGSEFTLRIACAALSESGRSELAFRKNSESTKTDIEGRRILIVDDDKTNQIVLRAYLNLKSCVTDIASNGQDAVEKFKCARFDLVFMDIEMPVMNGLDATVEIRKVELTQGLIETPVIGLSGYVDRKEAALAAGMNEFLSKPCQKDVIYDVIRKFATMHTNDSIISEFSSHRLEVDE